MGPAKQAHLDRRAGRGAASRVFKAREAMSLSRSQPTKWR
jgi:hypothetical protein